MISEFRTLTVDDLVKDGVIERPMDGNHGEIHPKKSDFVPTGIPFIMASDLVDGQVDIKHCAFIRLEQAASLRKGFARTGDVLLSHKATMGRTALVEELPTPYLMLTPQVTYYRVRDRSQIEPRYLKFYFDSPDFQELFAAWGNGGSTRSYLGITAQLRLPVRLPSIDCQRAISRVLGALDDKIALNRRMIRTLEATAAALFRSWFVDFDPVVAKAEGRRTVGVTEELFSAVPDRLADDGGGWLPVGWKRAPIGSLLTIAKDGVAPAARPAVMFDHYSIPAFDSGELPVQEPGALIRSGKFRVPADAILVSKLNPQTPRVWWPAPPVGETSVCSTEFMACRPRRGVPMEFLYSLLRSDDLVERMTSLVTGTSNSHQRAKPQDYVRIPVVRPSDLCMRSYANVVRPMLARARSSLRESRTLGVLRETLLPQLLSGAIRVRDAEQALAAMA